MAALVIGDRVVEARAYIGYSKHVHDEVSELEEALFQLARALQVLGVVFEQDLVIVHDCVHA